MQRIIKIFTISTMAVLMLFLVSCTDYDNIEKALTDAGYQVVVFSPEAEAMRSESKVEVKLHSFYKVDKSTGVAVYKFMNIEKMKDFYMESDTCKKFLELSIEDANAKDFYERLVQEGYANGNCLVVPYGEDSENVKLIIKGLNSNI